jgi:hypothetical protein
MSSTQDLETEERSMVLSIKEKKRWRKILKKKDREM